MLWHSEQRFVGVIDGQVAVPVVVSGINVMVVVGSILIISRDFSQPLSVRRDFAQRVMRRRQPGRQQRQKRR